MDLRFQPDYPEGFRVWSGDEDVAGIHHRLNAARRFAKGRQQAVELVPNRTIRNDRNAIKVLGIFKGWFFTHRVHVGYVRADTAKAIADSGLAGEVRGRLQTIWCDGYYPDYIVVRFDILAPYTPPAKTEKPKKPGGAGRRRRGA